MAGVNNHYLTFGSEREVVRVLDDAVQMNANVIRLFIQPVIGSPDGKMPTIWDWKSAAQSSDLGVHGNYVLYWDRDKNRMAINDGANGLGRLDFVLAEARKRHLRLIIALLDFWTYTGGAQQMRAWYGSSDENTFFFRDARTKSDYKEYLRHVLTRVNQRTGVAYRDDPTIFAWELMNEPYVNPPELYAAWIGDMATYVKSIDDNHLVSSGHANVDNRLSDIMLPAIDFASWHGYPLYYQKTPAEFDALIREFCAIGHAHNKPVLLEEFGWARSNADQVTAYRTWLKTIQNDADCAGWVVWRLVSVQDDGRYPRDIVDQFDIHNDGGALWTLMRTAASRLQARP